MIRTPRLQELGYIKPFDYGNKYPHLNWNCNANIGLSQIWNQIPRVNITCPSQPAIHWLVLPHVETAGTDSKHIMADLRVFALYFHDLPMISPWDSSFYTPMAIRATSGPRAPCAASINGWRRSPVFGERHGTWKKWQKKVDIFYVFFLHKAGKLSTFSESFRAWMWRW